MNKIDLVDYLTLRRNEIIQLKNEDLSNRQIQISDMIEINKLSPKDAEDEFNLTIDNYDWLINDINRQIAENEILTNRNGAAEKALFECRQMIDYLRTEIENAKSSTRTIGQARNLHYLYDALMMPLKRRSWLEDIIKKNKVG